MKTILGYTNRERKDGRCSPAVNVPPEAGEGYYIRPTVFADIPPKSKLEQEEIFGPVLVVIKARGFDHALEIANDTEFGLTGAVYTRSRRQNRAGHREFQVGNLYIIASARSDGGCASIRRLQHVRHGFQIWRPGLSLSVHSSQVGRGKD